MSAGKAKGQPRAAMACTTFCRASFHGVHGVRAVRREDMRSAAERLITEGG